jgi:DNA-binding MarR family transcriptional regulator
MPDVEAHEPATPGWRLRGALAGLELALTRHRRSARSRLGVSDEELTVLAQLGFAGPTAQVRLVHLSALSRSGMDALLLRLEQQDLLERRIDGGDRRRRVVALTEAGRTRLDAAFRARDEAALRAAAGQPATVFDALAQLVDALAAAAEAAADDPHGAAVALAASEPGGPVWRRWA